MATIGQQLTAPEAGWKRIDQTDSQIKFMPTTGSYKTSTSDAFYGGTAYYLVGSTNNGGKISFKFKGTKLRLIQSIYNDRSANISIKVDDISETYSEYAEAYMGQVIVYEKIGLTDSVHTVEISSSETFGLDAIDIDADGKLLHPYLNEKSSLEDMGIGDCIPCRYKAPVSGAVGEFSELGTCTASEIPKEGNVATPDGKFYFIKVDKGLLIADRVVQTNVSWQTLNNAGLIEGNHYLAGYVPANDTDVFGSSPRYSSGATYSKIKKNHLTFRSNTPNTSGEVDYDAATGSPKFDIKLKIKNLILPGVDDNYDIIFLNGNNLMFIRFNSDYIFIRGALTNGETFDIPLPEYVGKPIEVYADVNAYTMTVLLDGRVLCYNRYLGYNTIPQGTLTGYRTTFACRVKSGQQCEIEFDYVYTYSNSNLKIVNPTGHKIRSLSGGVIYADTYGNPTFTDSLCGAFPPNNEYDTYIKKSTLNGKIAAGDNNIWNYNKCFSFTKGSPIDGLWINRGGVAQSTVATSVKRMGRGNDNRTDNEWKDLINVDATYTSVISGFRPVLEFIEPDSPQQNAYY